METTKLLIIDDEPDILKIITLSFGKEGYQIITAVDGEEGMEKFYREKPQLVILDLMLPKIDGFEICRLLRKDSDVPVIILSAKGDELDRLMGFRMGSDDYVTKPFSPSELLMRVKAILRRKSNFKKTTGDNCKVGDLYIDLDRHEITMGNNKIQVTPKEFELLWLLASNSEHVLTREQLLDRIWDSGFQGDADNVTVMISRLRNKIEKDPSQPQYIKTVWGKGYKLSFEQ